MEEPMGLAGQLALPVQGILYVPTRDPGSEENVHRVAFDTKGEPIYALTYEHTCASMDTLVWACTHIYTHTHFEDTLNSISIFYLGIIFILTVDKLLSQGIGIAMIPNVLPTLWALWAFRSSY